MAEELAFDPRKLIMEPLRRCPKCGKPEFGILQVRHDSYVRLCRQCRASKSFALPRIRKAIIYLDQFAISNLMHVRTKEKTVNPFWYDLYAKLTHLSVLQLVVCPKSVAHMLESIVATRSAQLQTGAEMFAHDVFFTDFESIRHAVILKALDLWIRGDSASIPEVPLEEIVSGSPHAWTNRWRFTGTVPPVPEYIEALIADRDAAHSGLLDVFETKWKKNAGQTWEHWYNEEARAYRTELIKSYNGECHKWEEVRSGKRKLENVFDALPQPLLRLGKTICHRLGTTGVPKDDIPRKAGEFLMSDLLLRSPFIRISSSVYASLAMKAPTQKEPPTKGFFSDVAVMSCLIPYCDAMFLDRECAGYWREIQTSPKHKLPYETRVFSLATKDDLMAYLGELEKSATAEHRKLVRDVYNYPREQQATQ